MLNRHLLASLAALLIVSVAPASAATFNYAQGRRQIRACNLLLPGVIEGNPDRDKIDGKLAQPYYARAANSGLLVRLNTSVLKPAGWELMNPLAPPIVTPQIRARYENSVPLGAAINKSMPAYWDVKLTDVTLSRLLQFDVVYMAVPEGISPLLDADMRNKLGKLVDSGAQLWIDWGGGVDVTFGDPRVGQGLMIPDAALGFASGGTMVAQGLAGHSLLRYPYRLNQFELTELGSQVGSVTSGGVGAAILAAVVRNGNGTPQIVAGPYGAGNLIMTARNIGGVLAAANPPPVPFAAAAKFAYNVIAMGGNYPTAYGSAAHSSYARQGPDAGLQARWSAALPVAPGTSPVVCGGVVYVSGADGALYAFDATPEQDLDGNGNPDDGSDTSYRVGSGADLLWRSNLGGSLSTPTVCTWPGGDPVGAPGTDAVLVASSTGDVHVVAAWPNPTGQSEVLFSIPPSSGPVPAPTYHNGIIYVTGGSASGQPWMSANLFCFDPVAGQEWRVPGPVNPTNYNLEARFCSPTVGWTSDTAGGAMDLMAYWVTGKTDPAVPGSDSNDRLLSALMAVRAEPLQATSADIVATRYSGQRSFAQDPAAADPGYHLWTVDPQTGAPRDLTSQVNTSTFPPAGQWQFKPGQVMATWPIFADYRAARVPDDLGNPALAGLQDFLPRDLYSPTPQPQAATATTYAINPWKTDKLGATAAMGPDGVLYIVGDRDVPNGSASQISAVRDVGPRNQQLDERPYPRQFLEWTAVLASVYDRVDMTTYYPATDFTPDTDNVAGNNSGEEPLDLFKITGPAAVTDDAVYVTAVGQGSSGPAVALFAFERRPKFQIKLDSNVQLFDAEGNGLQVNLWQGNPFAIDLATGPPLLAAVGLRTSAIDYGRKTITFSNFEDAGLMMSGRPIVAGAPVHVYVNGVEVGSDKFSNLRWYFIPYLGTQRLDGPVSPPAVIGNYVYFGVGDGPDGYVFSVRKDANPSREKQVFGVAPEAGGEASKDVPEPIHVPNAGALDHPIAGAGGMVVASSNAGFTVLDSGATLIADSDRLIEVTGAGAAAWSLDAVDDGGVISTLSRPTVARIVNPADMVSPITGGGEMIVCDSGNNRIVRVTRGGQVLGEIREFEDPLGLLSAGEPRTLANPRDVRFWELSEPDPVDPNHPIVRVEHFLVADRDNFRVLDLVVRYDLATGAVLSAGGTGNPVAVNWVSASRSQGRMLRYETAQPFQTSAGEWDILSAVSNYTVTGESRGDEQGGGIVRLAYFNNPNPPAREYKHPGIISGFAPAIKNGGVQQRLVNPRFFERTWVAADDFVDLVCDNAGVWMLDSAANVIWGLSSDQYKNGLGQATAAGVVVNRGVPLRASSARLLPSGNILISNSYTGTNSCGQPFSGEVFEVNRTASPQQIVWCAPSIGSVVPCGTGFGFTQQIARSYLIEQPSFADRR